MSTLGFGKYADYELEDVPRDYLEWYIENTKRSLRRVIRELERRDQAEEAEQSVIERIVTAGYRELAKRNHPDAGGDTAAMQEINAANEALKDLLKRYVASRRVSE